MEHQNYLSTLPPEILTNIFSFLPKRERFICMSMDRHWRAAMDVASLWKHMCVRLDVDFFEVSTIQLTMDFCKYIKSLELKFEYPEEPMQWINYKMLDITKRTYRFLSIFVNKNLQINRLSFYNFCDFYRSKKILYYLSMFLRSQYKIKFLSFNGSFFSKKALIKILSSSIVTNQNSIEFLDIQNSYYEHDFHIIPTQFNLLSSQLMSCITSIDSLRFLKIDLDCLVFNGVLDGFLSGKCSGLGYLDIRIGEHDLSCLNESQFYGNGTWIALRKKFTNLRVSVIFDDVISYYDNVERVLCRSLPLHYLTWITETVILKDLYVLVLNKYCGTLEFIKITAKSEILDEFLIFAIETCPYLSDLEFSGVIDDLACIQENFKRSSFSGFYEIYVKHYGKRKISLSNEHVYKLSSYRNENVCKIKNYCAK